MWGTREAMQEKQTKRNASEPEVGQAWRHRRRRQFRTETEFISHRLCVRESMAGRYSLCQTGDEGSLVSKEPVVETRFAAFGSGESADF